LRVCSLVRSLPGPWVSLAGIPLLVGPIAAAPVASPARSPLEVEERYDASLYPHSARGAERDLKLAPRGQKRAEVFFRYYQGLTLERAGMIDAALDAYERAFRAAPDQQRLAYRAAELAGQFRDIERGLEILEENYRRNADRADAYLRLAEYLATYHENRKDRLDRSLAVLREAGDRFPRNPKVYDQLIQALLLRQEKKEAYEVLDRAMDQETKNADYWLEIAQLASRLHRPKKGEGHPLVNSLYEKALRLAGDNDVATGTRVGDYFRATEQLKRARDVYRQIIAAHPEELELREKLAAVYTLLGEEDKVLSTLLELERINPHRLETQKYIAQLYLKREDWNNAIKHYLKAFRISQGSPREYSIVAQMLRWENRAEEAISLLERARFHYPDEVELLVELAISHNAADDFATALKTFRETEKIAEKLRPDLLNDAFYFSYGAAAERSKDYPQAEELFRKAISLAPEDSFPARAARPYNYLGYMWLERDEKIEEAGELIRRANELMPDQGAYVDSLGWYYFKIGEYEKAVKTLLRAEELLAEDEEEDAVIYDHIAQAFFELGHKERALDYLQKALDLEPDSEEYLQRMEAFQTGDSPPRVPLDFLDSSTSAPEPSKAEEPAPEKPAPADPEKPEPSGSPS